MVIFNLKEEKEAGTSGEDYDKAAVNKILPTTWAVISSKLYCERVGEPEKHYFRPVKVKIGNVTVVSDIFAKSKVHRWHN